jgi:hypothetical protein
MINLGIYLPHLGDKALLEQCLKEINRGKENNLISDASIFFDNIGVIDASVNCGLFNSTDLWNFRGKLLMLSVDCAIKTLNIINDIDMFFGYGWGDKNVFATLSIVGHSKVKTICRTKELKDDFYRLTGKNGIGYSENLEGVIELMTN